MSDTKLDNTAIQVIGRMFSLLDTLAHEGDAVSLKSISEQTRLHPSTAHRILNDLAVGGLVERSGPGAYRLGIRLVTLGNLVKSRLDVRELAVRPMQELHRMTGHTVSLFVRHEDEAMCVQRTVTERSGVQVTRVMGLRLPLTGCAVGKALLINEPAILVRALCAAQGTAYEHVLAEIAQIRQSSQATDRESADAQLQVIATPIHDDLGGLVASLALNVSHAGSVPGEWPEALKACAQTISGAMGWQQAAQA